MYKFNRSDVKYGRSRHEGLPSRKVTYMTLNGLWWVSCDIRRLPGGMFRSGVVMRWSDKHQNWRTKASFHYGIEDDCIEFVNPQRLPAYVKEACIEVGEELAKSFPLRGKTLSPPEVECLI